MMKHKIFLVILCHAALLAMTIPACGTEDQASPRRAAAAAAAAPAAASTPAPATRPATQSSARAIDPRADELLRGASQCLGDAKSFTFCAEVWEDIVTPGGRKLQTQRNVEVGVRRPDHLVAHSRSQLKSREAWYDGKSLTIYDPVAKFFGVITNAPKTIDETVDFVSERFGVAMPLSDLVLSQVHRDITKNVLVGDYLGLQKVAGVPCHHLAFVQDDIDWQVWIEEGNRPLVRRLLITYKDEDQAPQFIATISEWNLAADLPDYAFQFRAPAGATKIDVLPAAGSDESGGKSDAADLAAQKQQPKTSDQNRDRKD
jgi:hypothetical protein